MKSIFKYISNNSLVSKSITVLVLRVVGVLLFFAITLYLTNFYDSDLVGKYDFIRSLIMSLGIISVFGMNQSVIYYSGYLIANNAISYLKKVYYKMLLVMLVITLVLCVITLCTKQEFINYIFEKNVASLVIKAIIALIFYGITIFNIDVFRAINKINFSEFFRNVLRYLPFFIAIVILHFIDKPELLVDVFLLNFVCLSILSTAYLYYYFSRKKVALKPKIEISYTEILKRSGPMAMSAAAYILMQSIDVVLITKFLEFKMVAFYSVAVKLSTIISIVLMSVNAVYAPRISELFNSKNHKALKFNIKQATRLIFIITFPLLILLILFSSNVLSFFGEEYTAAKQTLYILIIGQSINVLCGSVGMYMNMTGKQTIFQKILILALGINIFLNWILIPNYGINGAAFATSFSLILWNVIAAIYIYKKDKISTIFTVK